MILWVLGRAYVEIVGDVRRFAPDALMPLIPAIVDLVPPLAEVLVALTR